MKSLFKMFALCMLLTFTFHSNAQFTTALKPSSFSNFSSSITAPSVDRDKGFAALTGRKIQPDPGDKFLFARTALSSFQ